MRPLHLLGGESRKRKNLYRAEDYLRAVFFMILIPVTMLHIETVTISKKIAALEIAESRNISPLSSL